MKILTNQTILIISPEPWSHYPVSKQHYALTLAKMGNRVYFLNPPSPVNACRSSGHPDLWIVDYRPLLKGVNRLPAALAVWAVEFETRRMLKSLGVKFDSVWSFDPYRFQHLRFFNAAFNIYYAADVHQLGLRQNIIADEADIVLAPAQAILDQITTSTPKEKIPHAVADYFFGPKTSVQMPGEPHRLKILYVGNLHSKFLHYDLMKAVIRRNSGCDFIFIGDASNFPLLKSEFPNLWAIGEVENTLIPSWLAAADVLWLCYDTERFSKGASNSHKIMEYLSSGKVVVSTSMAEYLDSELLAMPEKNEHLPELMSSVTRNLANYNDEHSVAKRIGFARNNTYARQVEMVDSLLFKAIGTE